MAAGKWDDEDDSTPPSSPPQIARRKKFDDEEEDSDVVEAWDEAEDSEVEREKAKKAAEAKAKSDAEAAANKKSKAQRIEERRAANMRKRLDEDDEETSSDDEDDTARRDRLRAQEQAADLKHAEDLFSDIGVRKRTVVTKGSVITDPADPSRTIDLAALPLFNPSTKDQFSQLRETMVPLLANNAKKAQYTLFMQEFAKQIVKDLPSEQIKKIASGLTTLSNEKMKEEKAAEKGGKKSKAAKSKTALNANRDVTSRADTTSYDEYPLDDGDFM